VSGIFLISNFALLGVLFMGAGMYGQHVVHRPVCGRHGPDEVCAFRAYPAAGMVMDGAMTVGSLARCVRVCACLRVCFCMGESVRWCARLHTTQTLPLPAPSHTLTFPQLPSPSTKVIVCMPSI
jgi:hypothetical protein